MNQLAKIQYNQDYDKVNNSTNDLIKNKFKSWYECNTYYIKESIFAIISQLCQNYNPFIWKLLTNDMDVSWKTKDATGIVTYKYQKCIFCNNHMFENCNELYDWLQLKLVQMTVKTKDAVEFTPDK